jgi:hypothetical protein
VQTCKTLGGLAAWPSAAQLTSYTKETNLEFEEDGMRKPAVPFSPENFVGDLMLSTGQPCSALPEVHAYVSGAVFTRSQPPRPLSLLPMVGGTYSKLFNASLLLIFGPVQSFGIIS